MAITSDVTEHADAVIRARHKLELDSADHPLEFWLALIHIESHGRLDLEDRDSYVGPLQIGNAYLADAREYASTHYPYVLGELPTDKEELRSDDYRSLLVAMLYMERYAARHDHNPYRMAGMHKGGIGSAKQVTRKVRQGMSVEDAHHWVSTRWRFPAGHKREGQLIIPKLYRYVYGRDADTGAPEHRFAQALEDYTEWVERQHGDEPGSDAEEPDRAPRAVAVEDLARLLAPSPHVTGAILGKLKRIFGLGGLS